ncbi:MAG: ribonuclease H-like domain-containing protein [Lysobacteraceae bacterium]
MSSIAERLSRLRVQAGASVAAEVPYSRHSREGGNDNEKDGRRAVSPASDAVELVANLRRLIRSRRDATTRASPLSPRLQEPTNSQVPAPPLPGTEISPGLRLIEQHVPLLPASNSLTVRSLWPLLSRGLPHRVNVAELLFFDTETTGLNGGTGTRAFQIGAAHFDDDGLHVRQLLITRLDAEAAMLQTFADWMNGRTLVSYNGRSYDAPLLRTRWQLHRQRDACNGLHHIDLVHPVRRLYRDVWPDCRMATVERELLGIARANDLPGSEAPQAFRRWLQCGDDGPLRGVLAHNAQDLVSLARLLLYLTQSD